MGSVSRKKVWFGNEKRKAFRQAPSLSCRAWLRDWQTLGKQGTVVAARQGRSEGMGGWLQEKFPRSNGRI